MQKLFGRIYDEVDGIFYDAGIVRKQALSKLWQHLEISRRYGPLRRGFCSEELS